MIDPRILAIELLTKYGNLAESVVDEIIVALQGNGVLFPDKISMLLAYKTEYYLKVKTNIKMINEFNKGDENNSLNPMY